MRLLRLVKLAKIFRTLKAFRFFQDILLIFESLRHSLNALVWIFIMLGTVLYLFALIFFQAMVEFLTESYDEVSDDDRRIIYESFGSVLKSMLSLYKAITGGIDWNDNYVIVSRSGGVYAGLYIGFTFFFVFAMLNILTAVFVEKAATVSKPGPDEVVSNQQRKIIEEANHLRMMFEILQIDSDSSGRISWTEFECMMQTPPVVAYMASIGLEVNEPRVFFDMLCKSAGREEVTVDDFVDGCMQMRGSATSIDVHRNCFQLQLIQEQLRVLASDMTSLKAACHLCEF